jgi:hypothetical protein
MEREMRFIKIDDHTYRAIDPPGVKIEWDFDFTIVGEENGIYTLALVPRPGTVYMDVGREMLNKLNRDVENFFSEKGAVRFGDIFRKPKLIKQA